MTEDEVHALEEYRKSRPIIDFTLPQSFDNGWGANYIPQEISESKFLFIKNERNPSKIEWFNYKPFTMKARSDAEKRQIKDQSLFFEGEKEDDDFQMVEKACFCISYIL